MGNLLSKKEVKVSHKDESHENDIIKEHITEMVNELLIAKEEDRKEIIQETLHSIEECDEKECNKEECNECMESREATPTSMIVERAESKSSESVRDVIYQEAIE